MGGFDITEGALNETEETGTYEKSISLLPAMCFVQHGFGSAVIHTYGW
jgi:hypothetical protein